MSRPPHSRPVLNSSQSSRRHAGKSVLSQRKRKCLECLALLLIILARECELHSCVLHLVHISPKVSTSTWDENVNQALELLFHSIVKCFWLLNSWLPNMSVQLKYTKDCARYMRKVMWYWREASTTDRNSLEWGEWTYMVELLFWLFLSKI